MDMTQYGLVAVGIALFTIIAIALIEAGGRHKER
ncbi:hypothetical protein FHU39_001683 [Flexivirga oryzae]|uniref:Uncharacterized protein n=1 Tax=Flexivirga oryzae TaxID=1794944 RepID=A0A839N4L8_9MICO|nr:hypothetical protein [Flexivirga oryzae]